MEVCVCVYSFSSLWAAVQYAVHIKALSMYIMKVYIERKNMQVQLIPSSKNINFIDVGNFEVGNFSDRSVDKIGLIAIRDVSPLFCAGQSRG